MLFEKIQYFIDALNEVGRKHTTQKQLLDLLRKLYRSLQGSKLTQFTKNYERVFGLGLSVDIVKPKCRKTQSYEVELKK